MCESRASNRQVNWNCSLVVTSTFSGQETDRCLGCRACDAALGLLLWLPVWEGCLPFNFSLLCSAGFVSWCDSKWLCSKCTSHHIALHRLDVYVLRANKVYGKDCNALINGPKSKSLYSRWREQLESLYLGFTSVTLWLFCSLKILMETESCWS